MILLLFALLRCQVKILTLNPKTPISENFHQEISIDYLIHDEINSHSKIANIPSLPLESFSFTKAQKCHHQTYLLNNPSIYLYTSGTSGNPKIAVTTIANHFESAEGTNCFSEQTNEDITLLSLPLFHVGGLASVFRAFISGGAIVISNEPLESNLLLFPITRASFVPTQLYRLLKQDRANLKLISRRIKYILLGGAKASLRLIEDGIKANLPLHLTYGMSEMCSQVATTQRICQPSVNTGQILPHCKVKISEDSEICVAGKSLFSGYLKEGEIVREVTNGYFATGDIGKLSKENELICLGRKDRMFISYGENIQPEEIEDIILKFPGISYVKVEGIEDPEVGHKPVAYISNLDNFQIQNLIAFLEERLPKYKVPHQFLPFETIATSWKSPKVFLNEALNDLEYL